MKLTTKEMTTTAVLTAIICALSLITVPIGPVPISLAIFGVLFTGIIAKPKTAFLSVLMYILIGGVGVPVFSGFKGGFQVLAGPTGGYIISYMLTALTVSGLSKITKTSKILNHILLFAYCLMGLAVCYFIGTLQFMCITSTDLSNALSLCVYPFVIFDVIKSAMAVVVGLAVKKHIKSIK